MGFGHWTYLLDSRAHPLARLHDQDVVTDTPWEEMRMRILLVAIFVAHLPIWNVTN